MEFREKDGEQKRFFVHFISKGNKSNSPILFRAILSSRSMSQLGGEQKGITHFSINSLILFRANLLSRSMSQLGSGQKFSHFRTIEL